MNQDQQTQVHLIKLKLLSKNLAMVNVTCPFLEQFAPTVELKGKSTVYLPLIGKLKVAKTLMESVRRDEIQVNVQPLLEYPFDKHNLKIQTYKDQKRIVKDDIINLQLQFSLFFILKDQRNYVKVYFRNANLMKDFKVIGKMSPYIVISTQLGKIKTRPVKDGHLNPRFQQQIDIPFKSVFDKVFIQIKDGEETIGYQGVYIFELFGKSDERQLQLKRDRKKIGNLIYMVYEFDPQDF